MSTRPASIVFPYHDPDLRLLPHLQAILPDLKAHFGRVFISLPASAQRQARLMNWLAKEEFITVFPLDQQLQIGEHFAYLYSKAAAASAPDEILHLAYLDRLAFALEGPLRELFFRDVDTLLPGDLPLIFQRSVSAWQTHPGNYFEIENFVTTIGNILYGKTLDYAWCHLAIQASDLVSIMPLVSNPDLSMVAEMILLLQTGIHTRAVDWLSWEDPFILGRDAADLKLEREHDPEETQKRLAYTIPMVETLVRWALKQ